MSVKKMIDLYVFYNLSDDTWNMMYQMSLHGLISSENWKKFFEMCKGWTWSEDDDHIEDENGKVIYSRTVDGYMVKVN